MAVSPPVLHGCPIPGRVRANSLDFMQTYREAEISKGRSAEFLLGGSIAIRVKERERERANYFPSCCIYIHGLLHLGNFF